MIAMLGKKEMAKMQNFQKLLPRGTNGQKLQPGHPELVDGLFWQYIPVMNRALNLFVSGLATISATLVPTRGAQTATRSYNYLPSNTPMQAVAGDMLRVGAQIRIAQKERESLQQAEFVFSHH
jgi:hypothetical protein